MKRDRNHSELMHIDIEDEEKLPVTIDFANTSSDEDENEEIQAEQRRYSFRMCTPAQKNIIINVVINVVIYLIFN